jgi:hypothetical protein
MPRLRLDLTNWRPDLDETTHEGLTKADNVVHDAEGWKPVHLASSGSFATSLAASEATILSLVALPVGASDDLFCAWIADATQPTLQVGVNGSTATNSNTGHPPTFTTTAVNAEIWAFDVCEYGGKIIWTVEARAEDAGGTTLAMAYAGYMDYSSGNLTAGGNQGGIPVGSVTTSGLAPDVTIV